MKNSVEPSDILRWQPMPEIAGTLRQKKEVILSRWEGAVKSILPNADQLTYDQVRDAVPVILDQLAKAFEGDSVDVQFKESTEEHGETRYFQNFNLEQLLTEYHVLKNILVEEIGHSVGGTLELSSTQALMAGLDTAVQRGITRFVDLLSGQLREASERELSFLSFLSHDLRNNLNLILTQCTAVARKIGLNAGFNEEALFLESVRVTITNTIEGMEKLLSVERLTHGQKKPVKEEVNLAPLVCEVVAQFSERIKEKNLDLELLIPKGVVKTDRNLFILIVQNILGNAVKFSVKGKITISAEPLTGGGWKISVTDEAGGISAEGQAKIRDAFSHRIKYESGGAGIGLTIASEAARLSGATLALDSTPGIGSTFCIMLP